VQGNRWGTGIEDRMGKGHGLDEWWGKQTDPWWLGVADWLWQLCYHYGIVIVMDISGSWEPSHDASVSSLPSLVSLSSSTLTLVLL